MGFLPNIGKHAVGVVLFETYGLHCGLAFGHGEHEIPRHVSVHGRDLGDCSQPVRPCRTIQYARSVAAKGDRVLVAAGRYQVHTMREVFALTSGIVDFKGGFNRFDHFANQSPDRNQTTLTGVPREFRSQLRDKGFHVVADLKGLRPHQRRALKRFQAGQSAMNSSSGPMPCEGGMAGEFACASVDLLSHVALDGFSRKPTAANDVWGFLDLNTEREYALIGLKNGASVVDVSDPADPFEVGHVVGTESDWRDVKVLQIYNESKADWRSYGYVSTEATDSITVIDLTGLPNEVALAGRRTDNITSHNIYVSNVEYATNTPVPGWPAPLLQVLGSNERFGAFRSYHLSEPVEPQLAGQSPAESPGHYSHDATSMLVDDERATSCADTAGPCEVLFDFSESTVDLWDLSDQANPQLLSSTTYDPPQQGAQYVHSGWWSEDQRYLFVQDEFDEAFGGLNTTLRVFDLSSLTAPVLAKVWTGPTEAIDHNGYVRGNRYYMSNYTRGFTVLDITTPANPVEVGYFDTHPVSDSPAFDGAWGVYPFLPSGTILVSDFGGGLYVLDDRTRSAEQGSVAFMAPAFGGEEGTEVIVPVSRTGGTSGRVTVEYAVFGGSAGSVDVASVQGTFTWPAGDGGNRNIRVPLLTDGDSEPIERTFVRLANPTGGAVLGTVNLASLFIGDPGETPSVGFSERAIGVRANAERAIVTVRRFGSPAGVVEVSYATQPVTAEEGVDYLAPPDGRLRWEDGDARSQTIVIDLLQNEPPASNSADVKSFRVQLFGAEGGLLSEAHSLDVGIGGIPSVDEPVAEVAGFVDLPASGFRRIDLAGDFADPEGRPLAYDVSVDDPAVAEVSVDADGVVAVRGLASGQVSVTVTATAGEGDDLWQASKTYVVTVRGRALVPKFLAASDAAGQGFVRIINRSSMAGEVRIAAIDDTGVRFDPITLSIDAGAAVHFNSNDLEDGNREKGLSGGTGPGAGDWRLELDSDLEFEALAYIRMNDGFLTAMHDLAPTTSRGHRVATFNPGSNYRQESILRLLNPGGSDALVSVHGMDDAGLSPGEPVEIRVPAGQALEFTAAELEAGEVTADSPNPEATLEGALGDGTGKWRLAIESDREVVVLSLLRSPTGHLTNLSTAP